MDYPVRTIPLDKSQAGLRHPNSGLIESFDCLGVSPSPTLFGRGDTFWGCPVASSGLAQGSASQWLQARPQEGGRFAFLGRVLTHVHSSLY